MLEKGKYNNLYGQWKIGDGTTIGSHCDIGGTIGKNCKLQSYVFVPPEVTIGDNCFIGPAVVFLNDKYPPSNRINWLKTTVCNGARIGAGCIIMPGVVMGENALIGAGSLVTKDVPAGELWYGSPAKFIRENENSNNGK